MKTLSMLVKKNKLLIIILLVGLFFRIYGARALYYYSHDQDLLGWFVKDIVENHHLRLIGQETSTQGIFIGPIYYYFMVPFFVVFGMDPIAGVAAITVLGLASIISVYYVFSKVFNKKHGYIASFVYSISFYTIFNDREVAPTMPVIPWTVWYFYGLNLLLKGKQRSGFLVLGILIGLIWHFNMALILLLPLIPLAIWFSKKKVQAEKLKNGSIALLLFSLPLTLFEVRHGFSQTKWFVKSLTTHQDAIVSGTEQLKMVIHMISKNLDGMIWGSAEPFSYEITTFIILGIGVYLYHKKEIKNKLAVLLGSWIVLYVTFFSLYSKNMSEYYVNGALLPFFVVIVLGVGRLLFTKKFRNVGIMALLVFSILNIHRFFNIVNDEKGYIERMGVVAKIKKDSHEMGYPCVSVSFITKPGYDLGYRYLYWYQGLHVNRPDSEAPVYTIVYPLREDIETSETFGSIGLIYPQYSRYNIDEVNKVCELRNDNATDAMYGMP